MSSTSLTAPAPESTATQRPDQPSGSFLGRFRARLQRSPLLRHLLLGLVGLLLVVIAIESVEPFRQIQLATMAYTAIAAGGLSLLLGLSGQLSLGHGAFMAIGAYTTALLLQASDGALPLPVVLLIAMLVTLVVGAIIGVAAARLHGPYVAGATLALAVAIPGIALFFTDTLGGDQGLSVRVPPVPVWFDNLMFFITGNEVSSSSYVAYVGWFGVIAIFFLLANLSASRTGRRWRAGRDDAVAASLAGINVGRDRVVAFVVSVACAGLAGGVMALVVRLTAPAGFNLTLSLALLAGVVIGGLGTLPGALVGAAILTFLPQMATNAGLSLGLSSLQTAELATLAYGLTLMIVIVVAPRGIVGTLRAKRRERQERKLVKATA